jgi:hypothetical protein
MFSRSSNPRPRRAKERTPFWGVLRDRLMNDAFECYLAWRSEAALLEAAYRAWSQAPRSDASCAYAAYAAALDREECAAARYRTVLDEAGCLLAQGT